MTNYLLDFIESDHWTYNPEEFANVKDQLEAYFEDGGPSLADDDTFTYTLNDIEYLFKTRQKEVENHVSGEDYTVVGLELLERKPLHKNE